MEVAVLRPVELCAKVDVVMAVLGDVDLVVPIHVDRTVVLVPVAPVALNVQQHVNAAATMDVQLVVIQNAKAVQELAIQGVS